MRIHILPLACLILAGCASMNTHMAQNPRSWVGKSINDVQGKLGTPVLTDPGVNGTNYTYVSKSYTSYSQPSSSRVTTIVGPGGQAISVGAPVQNPTNTSTIIECTTTFEADTKGIVTNVSNKGEGC